MFKVQDAGFVGNQSLGNGKILRDTNKKQHKVILSKLHNTEKKLHENDLKREKKARKFVLQEDSSSDE